MTDDQNHLFHCQEMRRLLACPERRRALHKVQRLRRKASGRNSAALAFLFLAEGLGIDVGPRIAKRMRDREWFAEAITEMASDLAAFSPKGTD